MTRKETKPNIVILYADDLGFGDIGCYGSKGIPTPNLDRLASEGILFDNGYATAATCSPSRYSLITGSYPWRNPNAHILSGDAPALISNDTPTMPSILREAGYRTGVIGKWHIGMGDGNLDWNKELTQTPNDIGFDHSFIMAATNDRVPCVYVENNRVKDLDPSDPIEVQYVQENPFPELPTGKDNPELLTMKHSHGHCSTIVNGVGRIGFMRGGKSALWNDIDMADTFLDEAKSFVNENKDEPFFLYYAFHQPHVPRIPHPRFKGISERGVRGDSIVEMDWCVGEFMKEIEKLGLKEDTIVIFSSDNGPVLNDGYHDRAEELCGDHKPAGPLRGGKYSMFDGGTRVPFILSYPGTVEPGRSSAIVCHVDFLASFAKLAETEIPEGAAPDSLDMLDQLMGTNPTGRKELVVEGVRAKTVLRVENMIYIPPHEGPAVQTNTNTETGNDPTPQLYDLDQDIGQITNIAHDNPKILSEMNARLEAIRASAMTRD